MTNGRYVTSIQIKDDAEPLSDEKQAWCDEDYEEVEVWQEYTDAELEQMKEVESQIQRDANLNAIADLIKITTEQSDKLGYLWKCTYIGDICVTKEYIEDSEAKGTEDNPIDWVAGVSLIPNAYYLYDSKKYVYVGEQSVAGDIWDETDFELVTW